MSRIERYDEAAKTVDLHCSTCHLTHTVAAADAQPVEVEAGPPVLAVPCDCGTVVFVPFNDWSAGDLVPDVAAELFNHLHYFRGAPKHPEVRLIALKKVLGEDGAEVPAPAGAAGLDGALVEPDKRALTARLGKRSPAPGGPLVGLGEV